MPRCKRCIGCNHDWPLSAYRTPKARLCRVCKSVSQMWSNIKARVALGGFRPYKSYRGVELRMTKAEFWRSVWADVCFFLYFRTDERPSIDRLGPHYENGRIKVVPQRENSSRRSCNCFKSIAEIDALLRDWRTGRFTRRELALKYGTSDQTVGRLVRGQTYRWLTSEAGTRRLARKKKFWSDLGKPRNA